jgi:hypothetical protein
MGQNMGQNMGQYMGNPNSNKITEFFRQNVQNFLNSNEQSYTPPYTPAPQYSQSYPSVQAPQQPSQNTNVYSYPAPAPAPIQAQYLQSYPSVQAPQQPSQNTNVYSYPVPAPAPVQAQYAQPSQNTNVFSYPAPANVPENIIRKINNETPINETPRVYQNGGNYLNPFGGDKKINIISLMNTKKFASSSLSFNKYT